MAGVTASASAQNSDLENAKANAAAWLVVVDTGDYGKSYDLAGAWVQSTYKKDDWILDLDRARKPMGTVSQRTQVASATLSGLLGFPPGTYIDIEYTTAFKLDYNSLECVTMMKQSDGSWRPVHYRIKTDIAGPGPNPDPAPPPPSMQTP